MSLDAMKQALEALEMVTVDVKTTPNAYEAQRQAITALRAAIEQAEKQEPVAWMYDLKQRGSFEGVSTEYSRVKLSIGENWVPLYTAPRRWQGLTDEEVKHCYFGSRADFMDYARAIEAKLKEKNT